MHSEIHTAFPSAKPVRWDTTRLYDSPHDPEILKDRDDCLQRCDRLQAAVKVPPSGLSAEILAAVIQEVEELLVLLKKVTSYAQITFSVDMNDPKARELLSRARNLEGTAWSALKMMEVQWLQLSEEQAKTVMQSPRLRHALPYLVKMRRFTGHTLSLSEERILIREEILHHHHWTMLFDRSMAKLGIGKEKKTLSAALSDLRSFSRDKRKTTFKEMSAVLRDSASPAGHVLSAVAREKALSDELRAHDHWLGSRCLEDQISPQVIETMSRKVADAYGLVSDYYGCKQILLGLDKMYDFDRFAPHPEWEKTDFPWEEARDLVVASLGIFSREMAEVASLFFQNRWIHARVVKGKTHGARCIPTIPSHHPYLLLNYNKTMDDVLTLAHEMGHGIHHYLSRKQGVLYDRPPSFLAEAAAVFCEFLVVDHLLKHSRSPENRLPWNVLFLEILMKTLFRQNSLHRYEERFHTHIRNQADPDVDLFCRDWMECQREMYGTSVVLSDTYQYWWTYIPHFVHMPGYVHSYALAALVALNLFSSWKKQKVDFPGCFVNMLQMGGKGNPSELLRPVGVDMNRTDFIDAGLDVVRSLIDELKENTPS